MTFDLRPAGLPGPDGPPVDTGTVQRVFEPGGFAIPDAVLPSPAPPAPGPAGRLGVLGLPLMLRGDTAPPVASVAGRSDLRLDLGSPGHVTILRRDGLLSSTPLTRLPAEVQDTQNGVQGRIMDADGRTVGSFHDGVLYLDPEMERGLDTVAQALANGAGEPPRAGSSDASGCEEAPRGEPGRAAGQEALTQRDTVPNALQADSSRARALVRRFDPVLATPLAGLQPSDWQAHHLITREAAGSQAFKGVFDAAAAAGWREDSPMNLVGLPTNCPAQERLARLGIHRPLHTGSHPSWSERVRTDLGGISDALARTGMSAGDPAYQGMARTMLESLQSRLRGTLGGMDRVVQLPQAGTVG